MTCSKMLQSVYISLSEACLSAIQETAGPGLSNSYTMDCPPVRVDNPRALARGLPYVQVEKHYITI